MAWTYYCADDQSTLSAPSKEELVQKVKDHMQEIHKSDMTMDQVRANVEKNAKQTAA
ncbi:MAG: DUF1059 domain-containing protein [Armatimonadota bacterium]